MKTKETDHTYNSTPPPKKARPCAVNSPKKEGGALEEAVGKKKKTVHGKDKKSPWRIGWWEEQAWSQEQEEPDV